MSAKATWSGCLPSQWTVAPIKAVATCNDEVLPETTSADRLLDYVEIGDVDVLGGIRGFTRVAFGTAPSRARRTVKHGDVIVSTVRTYLRAIAAVKSPSDDMVVSTGFAVFRPRRVHSGFLAYVFQTEFLISEIIAKSVGVSYPAINASEIGAIKIPVPPPGEQQAIADFLDRETAKIDVLVAEQERLIALIEEKRLAVISHAVTQGTDTGVGRKESGAEWMGKVPLHWDVFPARRLLSERDQRSTTGGEELLTVSHLTGVTPRSEKNVNMFEATTTEGYKLCEPGDLVINTMWAWMGAMGVSRHHGIVSPAYNVYSPGVRLTFDYVNAIARMPAFALECSRYSKGVCASRLRLYPEEFFQILLPVPPIEEQIAITAKIRQLLASSDALMAEAERNNAFLKERRSALISAAVTGKIDVRGLVPAGLETAA
jgi:type I restriction enzyme S subunit